MRKNEQAQALRELAAEFHDNKNLFFFSCTAVGNIGRDLREEYEYLFELENVGIMPPPNAHELWTVMTPSKRQDQRVMMLCFMAAIVEIG